MIDVLFNMTFLPLKNITHYNHYLTEAVPPITTTTRRMKRLQHLEKHFETDTSAGSPVGSSTENVLQQNCHLMAVHSIDLCTEQFLTAYFILHLSTVWNCFTEQGRGQAFAETLHAAQPSQADRRDCR